MSSDQPGTLYVVGTPIGNLGDLTLRAADTLRLVQRVAAEDTRRTRGLLSHLGISGTPLLRLDAHAAARGVTRVLSLLERGENVALVTDAGMPTVSDPGARVVQAAADRGLPVAVVPGPSAVTTAVAASGLVDGPFLFVGFLPRRGPKRARALERIVASVEPVVLFEAPTRAVATLQALASAMPTRVGAVCRELTKVHEEVRRGPLPDLAETPTWRGEITIVLGPSPSAPEGAKTAAQERELDTRIEELLSLGQTTRTIVAELSHLSSMPRRTIYARVQQLRKQGDSGAPKPRRQR